MSGFLKSILAFFTLGMGTVACTRTDTPPPEKTPTDVTLVVPGMHWAVGWPDRVRSALATLPWVEQASIQTDIPTREVRFNLKDKSAWREEEVRAALKAKSFANVTVKSPPK